MYNVKKSLIKFTTTMLIVMMMSLKPEQVYGQAGIEVENPGVAVSFGKSITFTARIKASIPIQQVSLLFRGMNEDVTRVETLQPNEDGSVSFIYDASLNLFPPFSWIVFWYQATLEDGNTYTSSPVSFQYNDDRFPWRENTRDNVTVHWYAGDDAFGAGALDAASAGMNAIHEILPVSLDEPLNIYIYSNVDDLKATLQFGGQEWVGGHTDPALGVTLVSIAPGSSQKIEMETEIPHEIMHVMMYRALGENYFKQPMWLLEGVSSAMELYPNSEYTIALTQQQDNLIPFTELCASFPADSGSAFLAYAQSQSFVNYIRKTYGNSGLTRLMSVYSDGYDCTSGATKAFEVPLDQLDRRWRETVLGQNALGAAFRNLIPFLFLMGLVLIVPLWGAIDFLTQRRKRGQAQR